MIRTANIYGMFTRSVLPTFSHSETRRTFWLRHSRQLCGQCSYSVCTHLYQHNEGFFTDTDKRREWDSHCMGSWDHHITWDLTGHTTEPIKRPKFFIWIRREEAWVAPNEKKAFIYYRALMVSASEPSVWEKDLLALWKPKQPSHHLHQAPNSEQGLQIQLDEN